MSVTLRCLKCECQEFTKPQRLHKNAILTCNRCSAIALYGELLEAAGRRLMSELRQQLSHRKAG